MATVAWVRSIRGKENNSVCADHDNELRRIWDFFEENRIKGPLKLPPDQIPRAVALPNREKDVFMTDWFVPRKTDPTAGRYVWWVGSDHEKILYAHAAYLCRIGIPSFLTESHLRSLMRLFMCPEAYVSEALVPSVGNREAKQVFWQRLKKGFRFLC